MTTATLDLVARVTEDARTTGLEAARNAACSVLVCRWASVVHEAPAAQAQAFLQRADVLACLRDAPPRWGPELPAWAHRHADVAWHDHLDARVRWYREAARAAWDA